MDARAVDVVIVAKLDRLTRSVRDLADLLERFVKRGVALVSVAESLDTGTAAGRLVLNVMAAVSSGSARLSESARGRRSATCAAGQRVGTIPFGFELAADGSTLGPNMAEQRVTSLLASLRASGYTLQAIADELNRQGFRTGRGTPWQVRTVHHLLAA